MKRNIYAVFCLFVLGSLWSCSSDEDVIKDDVKPIIVVNNETDNPIPCQVYHKGEVIAFRMTFRDNVALGNFNIEIHNNFDHHTHGTSAGECPLEPIKDPVSPWVYNQDFSIPANTKSFDAVFDIAIPTNIDSGDYHFMIRVTDSVGWQELRAESIKIVEEE